MSLENPVQIDLSDDNSWDQIQGEDVLTQEDRDFLKERFDEESEGIIYLSQQELQELKTVITGERSISQDPRGAQDSAYNSAESLDSFVDRQKLEGLTLSDMVKNNDTIPDIIKGQIEMGISGFEEIAEEKLFGEEGIFKNLDISPTAQDHMSVSMSMSFMENGMNLLQQKIDSRSLTPDDINEFISLGEDIESKLADIKTISDMNLPVTGSPNQIHIKQNGELNKIFMDPSSGIDFFNNIISGDVTSENVEEIMENANVESSQEIQLDLADASSGLNTGISRIAQSISNMSPEQQEQLLQSLARNSAPDSDDAAGAGGSLETSPTTASENAETSNKKSLMEKILEMLQKIFEGILDFGEESNSDSSPIEPVAAPVETQNTVTTLRASLLGKLTQGAFTGMQESSLREFFSADDQIQALTDITQNIPTLGEQDTPIDKLENLFFTPIQSDENIMKIDAFVDAGGLENYKNADNSLNSENLLGIIRAYSNYRIAHSEDTSLSYEAYFTNMSE